MCRPTSKQNMFPCVSMFPSLWESCRDLLLCSYKCTTGVRRWCRCDKRRLPLCLPTHLRGSGWGWRGQGFLRACHDPPPGKNVSSWTSGTATKVEALQTLASITYGQRNSFCHKVEVVYKVKFWMDDGTGWRLQDQSYFSTIQPGSQMSLPPSNHQFLIKQIKLHPPGRKEKIRGSSK